MVGGVLTAVGLIASVASAGCSSAGGGSGGGETRDAADTGVDSAADSRSSEDVAADARTGAETGRDVRAAGFGVMPPRPADCEQPGATQRLPFYFRDRDLKPIAAGDRLFDATLESNRTVGAGVLESRRMRVSPANRGVCGSSASCRSPLKCGATGLRGTRRHCTRPTGLSFTSGTAKMDYVPNRGQHHGQLVAILMENSNMWRGQLPRDVNGKHDRNGELDFREKEARASDPELKHRRAIAEFSEFLATAVAPDTTRVSFWFFAGQVRARVRPLVGEGRFDEDLTAPKSLLEAEAPDPTPRPSNLYQAIIKVANKDLGLDRYEGREKFMLVVTDGPNEVWASDATRQKVNDVLDRHGIHLIMLHLDAPIDPDLLRDLPTYWQGNAGCRSDPNCDGADPCTSDADCANFESCRKATIYAEDETDQVERTQKTYCMPSYRQTGRLGPIDAFADFACRSEGHYLYATDPEQLVWYAQKLPFLLDGQWSVEADFSALDPKVGLAGGFYRLSGFVSGLLGPNLTAELSDVGSGVAHPVDTRPVMRIDRGGDQ